MLEGLRRWGISRPVLDFSRAKELRAGLTKWEFFVLRHRQRGNLWVHFFCGIFYWVGLVGFLSSFRWIYLLGPLLSSLLGSPSHYLFQDGIVDPRHGEGVFTGYVPFFVGAIYVRLAMGRYEDDILRAEAKARDLLAEPLT